ncbi:MAG: hypothetical protein JWR63_2432 [Conexibacter sp.]|nr:hypothetical protein [Conexibacter sp.]
MVGDVPALRDLWRRGQQGWPSRFVLVQLPNGPLIVGLVAGGVAGATGGGVHDVAAIVGSAGLAIWALQELLQGVNGFRRGLGAAMLAYLVATRVL